MIIRLSFLEPNLQYYSAFYFIGRYIRKPLQNKSNASYQWSKLNKANYLSVLFYSNYYKIWLNIDLPYPYYNKMWFTTDLPYPYYNKMWFTTDLPYPYYYKI